MSTTRSTGVIDRDAHALAHLAVRLRAETVGCCAWDLDGTTKVFLRVLVGKNLQIATEVVLAHALDPDAKTPNAISRPFTPARREPADDRRRTPDRLCDVCNGWKGSCGCTSTVRPVDATEDLPQTALRPGTPEYRAAALTPKETR